MQNEHKGSAKKSRLRVRLLLLLVIPVALVLGERALSWAIAQLKTFNDGDVLTAADLNAQLTALNAATRPDAQPGASPATAGTSCAALKTAGATQSGVYYIKNPASADAAMVNMTQLVYCDQVTNGGGWALVQNSILGFNTTDFWNIPYAARFGRRGRPSMDSNFYDGSIYQTAPASYMDIIEDLQGKAVMAFVATTDGINNTTMRFNNPAKVSGNDDVYNTHFASGWSAPDYDGDTSTTSNCATQYSNVTQHYGGCWNVNLGSDADTPFLDSGAGPHIAASIVTALALSSDGPGYSRVRRLSRFVRW